MAGDIEIFCWRCKGSGVCKKPNEQQYIAATKEKIGAVGVPKTDADRELIESYNANIRQSEVVIRGCVR